MRALQLSGSISDSCYGTCHLNPLDPRPPPFQKVETVGTGKRVCSRIPLNVFGMQHGYMGPCGVLVMGCHCLEPTLRCHQGKLPDFMFPWPKADKAFTVS